jgi:DNA-binding transcriptional MerR regulator
MDTRRYSVGDVARIANTTVRTLHHYDEIGLLKPSDRSERGYRLYSDEDLLRLQQIHIGRSLGMSLEQIRAMLDDPEFDQRRALVQQREQLVARKGETERMLAAIDAALGALSETGEGIMDPGKMFDGFDPARYEDEARERWGETDAYAESSRRTSKYGEKDWARMRADGEALMAQFIDAMRRGASPTDDAVLTLAERHRLHIDQWFYPCSRSMHAALAQMYLADGRFERSFESRANGLAAYLSEAILANSKAD